MANDETAAPASTAATPAAPATSAPEAPGPSLRDLVAKAEADGTFGQEEATEASPDAPAAASAPPKAPEPPKAQTPDPNELARMRRELRRQEMAVKESAAKVQTEAASLSELRELRDLKAQLAAGNSAALFDHVEKWGVGSFESLLESYAAGRKGPAPDAAVAKVSEEIQALKKQIADRDAETKARETATAIDRVLPQIRDGLAAKISEFPVIEAKGLWREVFDFNARHLADPENDGVPLPWEEAARIVEAGARARAEREYGSLKGEYQRLKALFEPDYAAPSTPASKANGTASKPSTPTLTTAAATSSPAASLDETKWHELPNEEFRRRFADMVHKLS